MLRAGVCDLHFVEDLDELARDKKLKNVYIVLDMPGLGRIKVEGMRRTELVNHITNLLTERGLVKDPVVSVSFLNYRITVLGEVNNPGTYTMPSERVTVLQALGMASDLKLTADRHDILLIRDENGKQTHYSIDLTQSDILNSELFYLHQNDVIYVPQSTKRIVSGTTPTGLWSGATSMDTTLPAVVANSGNAYAAVSVYHGFVLTVAVPFIVTFFISLY